MTKAKEHEEELTLLRTVTDFAPAIIYIKRRHVVAGKEIWKIEWMNRFGLDLFGYSLHEMQQHGADIYREWSCENKCEQVCQPMQFELTNSIVKGEVTLTIFHMKERNDYRYVCEQSCAIPSLQGKDDSIRVVIGQLFTPHMLNLPQVSLLLKNIQRSRNQPLIDLLSNREIEVSSLISRGKTDEQIAKHLHISISTAKKHRSNILHKMKVRNTAELVAIVAEYGMET